MNGLTGDETNFEESVSREIIFSGANVTILFGVTFSPRASV